MNKKLYTRIYRENPLDRRNPIYVGDYYEKQGGLPANVFRWIGISITAAVIILLMLLGNVESAPGETVYTVLAYAACYLPAILGLFACLQAPTDDRKIQEDVWHNSLRRIRIHAICGVVLCGVTLLCGVAACMIAAVLGTAECVFLVSCLLNMMLFALLLILRNRQQYILKIGKK